MGNGVETPNLVSQALSNAKSTSQEIAALTGLPSEAVPTQAAAVALVGQIVPPVNDMQRSVRQFLQVATPLLTGALAALDGPAPVQAKTAIAGIQNAAKDVGTVITKAGTAVKTARDNIDTDIQALANVQRGLDGEIAAARAQQQTYKAQVDSLNSKKYYWLALGPLGLVGLGIAIKELEAANNNVAAMEAKISALDLRVSQFTKMKVDVDQLKGDLQALAGKFESLKNAIDFVSADVQLTLKDLDDATTKSTAKAYLLTAKGEMDTLAAETA
jgi:hypothetical protein